MFKDLSVTLETYSAHSATATSERKQTVKQLFETKPFQRLLIFSSSQAIIGIMPGLILPAFGGRYFSTDCNDTTDDCTYNYTTYNFYNSAFASLDGFIAFIMAGFIGALSDSLGRKPFLFTATFLNLLTYTTMILRPNIWILWICTTLISGIFGNIQVLSSLETSYIADITTSNQRTIGFTIVTAVMATSLLIGSGISTAITIFFHILTIFSVMGVGYLLLTIYTGFFLPESLEHKKKFICKRSKWNICKPLLYVKSNPIIFWISMMNLLCSVSPSALTVLLVYLNDQININDDDKSVMLNVTVFATLSVSAMICAGMIVPCVKSKFRSFTDIHLASIGVIMLIISALTFSIISFITDSEGNNDDVFVYCFILIIIGAGCLGGLALIFPAASAILSNSIVEQQHGVAFGIVRAYQSITTIIAPFGFGYGYNASKEYLDFPSLIWYITVFFLIIAWIILIGPLNKAVKELKEMKRKYSFETETEDKTLLTEMSYDMDIEHSATVNSYNAMTSDEKRILHTCRI